MSKTIHIAPITRVEGHGSIAIHLDDAGNVKDTKVHYMSLRGFENSSREAGRGSPKDRESNLRDLPLAPPPGFQ